MLIPEEKMDQYIRLRHQARDVFEKVTRKSVTRSEIQDLDEAVLDAYEWTRGLTDEEDLERLLVLNLKRAAAQY